MSNEELSKEITERIMETPILSAPQLYSLVLFILNNQPKQEAGRNRNAPLLE